MFQNLKKHLKRKYYSHSKINIAYIESYKLAINNTTYIFFNDCENVYINTLEKFIPFNKLKTTILFFVIYDILIIEINLI